VYWLIGVSVGVTFNGAVDAAVVAVSCLGVTCLLGSGGIGVRVGGTIGEVSGFEGRLDRSAADVAFWCSRK
jgi:hypothetical protein